MTGRFGACHETVSQGQTNPQHAGLPLYCRLRTQCPFQKQNLVLSMLSAGPLASSPLAAWIVMPTGPDRGSAGNMAGQTGTGVVRLHGAMVLDGDASLQEQEETPRIMDTKRFILARSLAP